MDTCGWPSRAIPRRHRILARSYAPRKLPCTVSSLPTWVIRRIRAGRAFEKAERREWLPSSCGDPDDARFEAPTVLAHKRGRIDVRLQWKGLVVLIELKATSWDRMKAHRVRPNALRHLRQLYRYVDGELERDTEGICHGIVYERAPRSQKRRKLLEALFHEHRVQLVWRHE